MIINLKLDYNPTTEECKVIKAEVESPKKTSTEASIKVLESNEPQITLDSTKYTLNAAAAELMQVVPNTRIDIKYQMVDGVEYPVIGTEENFGSGGGNKLTKALTVSYRGKANERLSRFGEVFTVTPMKDISGLFVLIGNSKPEQVPDEIEVIEDMNNHEDLPLADMDGDPLNFDDDPTFTEMEDSTLIDEDSLKFD